VAYYLCANAEPTWDPHVGLFDIAIKKGTSCLVFTQAPEVNHIEPCIGKHATWGCHHHEENLEVLCRPCHLAETAKQRSEGKFQ
jgi:5-methylcytosine-specific restriction endonuclease McrA